MTISDPSPAAHPTARPAGHPAVRVYLKRQVQAELHTHKTGRPTATKPTRLDQLAAKGIASATDATGISNLADYHGLELLDLTHELLGYSTALTNSGFGQANFQKLFAALLNYQKHFATDHHWQLVDTNIPSATLRWRCRTVALPEVVDSITRTARLAATLNPTDPADNTSDRPAVVRECDLTNPKSSLLTFPNERRTVTWCVADDPIRMRAAAFPHLGPSAVHVATSPSKAGTVRAIGIACDQLEGRWVR